MDAQESRETFQRADQLYREGRYQEALELLEALNRVHAHAKNVLYPAALCLNKLGRGHEALPICEELIARFQDPRAAKLKNRILSAQAPTVEGNLGPPSGTLDPVLDFDMPSRVSPYKPVEPESNWKMYTLIGVGVAVLAAFLIIPPLIYEAPPPSPAGQSPTVTPEGLIHAIGIGTLLLLLAANFMGNMAGGYIALMLMNQLPSQTFSDNCISVGSTIFICTLLGFVPLVGPILSLVFISKAYDLGCGGLLFFVIMAGVGSFLATIIPLMMLMASVGALTPAA